MLRQQSVKVGDALMRAQWPEISRYFKNDILIIQTCSLRPITLSGAKIFPLDISQLKMVGSSILTPYAVLFQQKFYFFNIFRQLQQHFRTTHCLKALLHGRINETVKLAL